jgi:hypothetical protein
MIHFEKHLNLFALLLLSVLAFSCEQHPAGLPAAATKTGASENAKPLTDSQKIAIRKNWEASPEGKSYHQWATSPAGQKVFASEAKIRKCIRDKSKTEGIVTSLSLPPGSRLGFGFMIRINEEDYILSFGTETSGSNEFQALRNLKESDKIKVQIYGASHAPKYSYPILSAAYVEMDGETIYKRPPGKGGC